MMKVYTKRGDSGETDLRAGKRVSKTDRRITVCGEIDELSAVLGTARAEGLLPEHAAIVFRIQQELIEFGAEVALRSDRDSACRKIEARHLDNLEKDIDRIEVELPPLTRFVIPGEKKSSALLHLARTVCRRAERSLVALRTSEPDPDALLLPYLNRLSDLLFVTARREDL